MTISIEQASQELARTSPTPRAVANTHVHYVAPVPASTQQTIPQTVEPLADATLPGMNPQDFVAANRIHIKDGSLFVDPFLVLHPRELAPENEAALRKKLQLTYSINNPSFFESQDRAAIALNLGELIPVAMEAKRSKLMQEVDAFKAEATTGIDPTLQKELQDKKAPFAAIVRDVTQHPSIDPVGLDMLKNSLAMYLLVREKLTQNNFLDKLTTYVKRSNTPDQVLADLSTKTGVTPLAMREAAFKGGLDGVGQLLGLDPRYVADVKALTNLAATQDFGYNTVEHWHLGRQLQGINAPIAEKLLVGMDARITAKIPEYRDRVHHQFQVPDVIQKEERRIADGLALVDPVERTLLYKLGYEICYSPEVTADDIAFYRGIYGLHRKAANDLRDVQGTYRIYFSGHGDEKGSMRTLVHEVAHNLWPAQFEPGEAQKIDQLAASDQQRFTRFQRMMDDHFKEFETLFKAYQAGNEQEKAAVISATNQTFAAYGLQAEGLFPYLREANDFKFVVKHLYDTLNIEGDRYNHSNYNSPQERFREVISRFAELKQVEYRGEPQFIQFLAPGLNQVWEAHYLPHLARVSRAIDNGTLPAVHATASPGLAKDEQPKVQQQPAPVQPGTATRAPNEETLPGPAFATAQPCTSDDVPLTMVDPGSIAPRSLNTNTTLAPAFSALNSISAH